MKKIVYKYRISKFKRFTNGLLFAVISVIAFTLCVVNILNHTTAEEIILPFCIAIISMLLGLFTMFWNGNVTNEKV